MLLAALRAKTTLNRTALGYLLPRLLLAVTQAKMTLSRTALGYLPALPQRLALAQ